jgi:nitroreductase
MMGWFDEKDVKKLLNIDTKKRVPLIITLGYAESDEIREKERKKIEEFSDFNRYK